jgi:hypothetical protein
MRCAQSADLLVLKSVLGVVGSLASSLQAQLSVPGEAPVTLSTPSIQASVALDLTAPGSRLFTSATSAPGSGASFGALPPGALPAGSGAVLMAFHSLSFDPHTGSANGSGSARFALTAQDGAPLVVQDLATPIAIALPPLSAAALAGGAMMAVCSFWNETSEEYSTDGCVGLPSPLPPGMAASFDVAVAAAGAAGAAELAASVLLGPAEHPLLAACSVSVLDCGSGDAVGAILLDPSQGLLSPSVQCPSRLGAPSPGVGSLAAGAPPALRVYHGAGCALWQQNNTAQCHWDAMTQAFAGAGCAPSGAPEQCLCRHVRFASLPSCFFGAAHPDPNPRCSRAAVNSSRTSAASPARKSPSPRRRR